MDATLFDRLTRSLSRTLPRRRASVLLAAAGLGVLAGAPPALDAKKGKKKKQKLQFNSFGCVNVGGKCRGNSANCCSNICEGKKPKKGKKDTSRCIGHDASTCQPGQTAVVCGGLQDIDCLAIGGAAGGCYITTGNAAFCSAEGGCFPCQKDADCIGVCGPGAACVPCATPSCADEGGTTCRGPADGSCTFEM
jgi:hypothetical protein